MLKLCRYGGLNAIKQKHYNTDYDNMTYHGAPEKYGFYSFLYPYIDWFFLTVETGKIKKNKKNKQFKNKRENLQVPYKKFSIINGDIWTHIEPSEKYRKFIKEERGSWYKIDSQIFNDMFKKEYALMTGNYIKYINNTYEDKKKRKKNLNFTPKSPYKFFSKDYLEIFVPKNCKIK